MMFNISFHRLISFSLITSLGLNLCAQEREGILRDRIDSLVKYYVEKGEFSGSILVADEGKIIYDQHFGFQELEERTKINSASVFEIASLSKSFSAVLVLKLVQEGKLELDKPLQTYLSSFPYSEISIRHLLSHTSGLSERKFFAWAGKNIDPKRTYTNKIILEYLVEEKPELSFPAGTAWEYSNLGYFLLPLLIEEVSSKPFLLCLEQEILIPLKMDQTGVYAQEVKGNEMENYAFGKLYNERDKRFVSAFGMAKSDSIYGSVGMLSNTSDLFKWDRALYTNQFLRADLRKEAFTAYKLNDGSSAKYGLGWFIHEEKELVERRGKRVDHYGIWPGYESSMVRFIDQDKCLIILSNQSPSAKDQLISQISEMLFSD
ncbi:MAG: serine hydrolase domain-containing protein [Bacteroidota bacterium]